MMSVCVQFTGQGGSNNETSCSDTTFILISRPVLLLATLAFYALHYLFGKQ